MGADAIAHRRMDACKTQFTMTDQILRSSLLIPSTNFRPSR